MPYPGEITVRKCDSCGGYHLELGGASIMTSSEEGPCRRVARVLSESREMSHRGAVRHIMDQVGLSEQSSLQVVSALHGRNGATLQ